MAAAHFYILHLTLECLEKEKYKNIEICELKIECYVK